MYSLVIAEDEFTTRRGLVNMVQWREIGRASCRERVYRRV